MIPSSGRHPLTQDVGLLAALAFVAILAGAGSLLVRPIGNLIPYHDPDQRLNVWLQRFSGKPALPAVSTPSLSLQDYLEIRQSEAVITVDARAHGFFLLSHIPGAVSLGSDTFAQNYSAIRDRLTAAKAIVVYCSDENCADSRRIAAALAGLGHEPLFILEEGYAAWLRDKLPTEISP